jgi:hypothetical protein
VCIADLIKVVLWLRHCLSGWWWRVCMCGHIWRLPATPGVYILQWCNKVACEAGVHAVVHSSVSAPGEPAAMTFTLCAPHNK